MALYREQDYRLRWLDFDRYGHIQPVTVLDLFQDAATLHADELGMGRNDMMASGVFWVVVRSKYEVVREPTQFQMVRIRTWPRKPTSFSIPRDFTMCDEAGNLLIKATTEWVFVNAETRKFARLKDHYRGPADFCDDRAFDDKLRKVPAFDEGNRPVVEIAPAFSDIDLNGHVNNARYPHFVIDALNPTESYAVKTFQIDYRYEVLPDKPLAMHTLVEDGLVLSKGVREDGTVAFASAIELA